MPTIDTSGRLMRGASLDRTVFRRLLPDDRWYVYAAGWAKAGDTNTLTIRLVYEKDDKTTVTLGSVTHATNTWTKKALGPFDVFATVGVPAGESIPMVRLYAIKASGADATIENWNLITRFIPARR